VTSIRDDGMDDTVTHELVEVVRMIRDEHVSVKPSGLVRVIYETFKEQLSPYEQNDMSELWMLISDKIAEEHKKPYNPPTDPMRKRMHKLNEGVTSKWLKTIQGLSKTTITCAHCPHKLVKFETFSMLSLDIGPHDNLIDLLQTYVASEPLSDYACDGCRQKDCRKVTSLVVLPKVLVLVLKRFKMTNRGFEKVISPVSLPDNISINNCSYKLMGIGNHFGSYNGGHYTALCRKGSDPWVHYDDTERHIIASEQSVLADNTSAYMLFYVAN